MWPFSQKTPTEKIKGKRYRNKADFIEAIDALKDLKIIGAARCMGDIFEWNIYSKYYAVCEDDLMTRAFDVLEGMSFASDLTPYAVMGIHESRAGMHEGMRKKVRRRGQVLPTTETYHQQAIDTILAIGGDSAARVLGKSYSLRGIDEQVILDALGQVDSELTVPNVVGMSSINKTLGFYSIDPINLQGFAVLADLHKGVNDDELHNVGLDQIEGGIYKLTQSFMNIEGLSRYLERLTKGHQGEADSDSAKVYSLDEVKSEMEKAFSLVSSIVPEVAGASDLFNKVVAAYHERAASHARADRSYQGALAGLNSEVGKMFPELAAR